MTEPTLYYKILAGFGFGGFVAFFNFWVLKRGVLFLGDFRKRHSLFLIFLLVRYVLLACGILILLKWKALEWRSALAGLFSVYVGLLVYEAVKLRSAGLSKGD